MIGAILLAPLAVAQVTANGTRKDYYEYDTATQTYERREPNIGEADSVSTVLLAETVSSWLFATPCDDEFGDLDDALTMFDDVGIHLLGTSAEPSSCASLQYYISHTKDATTGEPLFSANFVDISLSTTDPSYAMLVEAKRQTHPTATDAYGVLGSTRRRAFDVTHSDGSTTKSAGWVIALNGVEHYPVGSTLPAPNVLGPDDYFEIEVLVHELLHALGAAHLSEANYASSSLMYAVLALGSTHGGLAAGGSFWGTSITDPDRSALLAADRRFLTTHFSFASAASTDTRLFPLLRDFGFAYDGTLSMKFIPADTDDSPVRPQAPQSLSACPGGPLEGQDVDNLIHWMPQVDQVGPAASAPVVNFYARNTADYFDRFSFVGAQPVSTDIFSGHLVDPVPPTNGVVDWYVDTSAYSSTDETYRIYAEVVGESTEPNSGDIATPFTFDILHECGVDEAPPACCP